MEKIKKEYEELYYHFKMIENLVLEKDKIIENSKFDLKIKQDTINTLKKEIENYKNNKYIDKCKCLKQFNNLFQFLNYCENEVNIKKWKIYNMNSEDRIEILTRNTSTYNQIIKNLKEEFDNKNLCFYPINNKQLISFFDTMSIMYQVIKNLYKNNFNNNITILMEYVIPNTEKQRIDYILTYKNQLLMIEFSNAKKQENIKKIYKEKNQQIHEYKENIKKYISKDIEITTETFIYLPNEDDEYQEKLDQQINNLSNIIKNIFNKAPSNALDELIQINKE